MYISTRCAFPNFVITSLSGVKEAKNNTTSLFPKLTSELIKDSGKKKE